MAGTAWAYAECLRAGEPNARWQALGKGDWFLMLAFLLLFLGQEIWPPPGPLGQTDSDTKSEGRSTLQKISLIVGVLLFAFRTWMRLQGWFYDR